MSCTGRRHELPASKLHTFFCSRVTPATIRGLFSVEATRIVLPSATQQSTVAFSLVRETPRLWTTARFRESILPKWTREQEFQNRFARNTHHSDISLNDICDAPALFCDRAVTKRFQSYIVCLLLFQQSFIIKPSSFRFTLLHTHTHTPTHNRPWECEGLNFESPRYRPLECEGLNFVSRVVYSIC